MLSRSHHTGMLQQSTDYNKTITIAFSQNDEVWSKASGWVEPSNSPDGGDVGQDPDEDGGGGGSGGGGGGSGGGGSKPYAEAMGQLEQRLDVMDANISNVKRELNGRLTSTTDEGEHSS